jgi:hypothetical protein
MAKIAVSRQINSIKNLTNEQMELICLEQLAKREMHTRACVTDNRRLLNPSIIERELDSVLIEVGEIIDRLRYLQRCKRWATSNQGANFSTFCNIMNWGLSQDRLKEWCAELEYPSDWVDTLVPVLHDDSAAFGFSDSDLEDGVDSDPSGMVDRKPSLEQLDGEPF